ncbi:hypothetical protein BC937DRAFT_88129 [Endogone sp. FLAS-F59071]|nr:hypothetical protein BC937DRAFT_88129 [Endogone sp. FLAS-F59071]|eukprot:RUS18961.1 hypothetical protein BC937DRAFT_88129 [Endogone sp. FLAS-F59071]
MPTVTDYRQIQQVWNPAKHMGRTGTACTRCRRKQVKCDGATPRCRRCAWGDHDCIYLKVVKPEPDLKTLQSEAIQKPATMSRKHQKLIAQVRDMERQMENLREEMRSLGRAGSSDDDIESDISSLDSVKLEYDEYDFLSFSDTTYGDMGSPEEQTIPDSAEFREVYVVERSRTTTPERPMKCQRKQSEYEMKINVYDSQAIVSGSHSIPVTSSIPTQWKLTITANGVRIQTGIKNVYQLNHLLASAPQLLKVPSQQQKRSARSLFILWNNRWSKYTNESAKDDTMQILAQTPVATPADQDSKLQSYIQAHESEILYFIVGVWLRSEPHLIARHQFMTHYRLHKLYGCKQVPGDFNTLLYSVGCIAAFDAFKMHMNKFKCDEPLPLGVTASKMGGFVADYFFPLVKDGIFAYLDDPEPSPYIMTSFFHVLLYLFHARQIKMASTYLSMAARVATTLGYEFPDSGTQAKHAVTAQHIKSSIFWTILSNYDEAISFMGFPSVISDRERRLAIASQILTQPNNLSVEDLAPLQFHISFAKQSAINRDIFETFYREDSPAMPSTDDLTRFEEMWAEWWDELPPWLRPTPQYQYPSHSDLMNALRMGIVREIGTIDIHLPFIDRDGIKEKDFDPILLPHFPIGQTLIGIGQTILAPADKRPKSRPSSPASLFNEDLEDEQTASDNPARLRSSHVQHAIRICSQSAVRATKLVLAIHKHGGNRFPLFELGRACEVHVGNLSAKEPDIAATARGHLALSHKIITESIPFQAGDDRVTTYAKYLKDVMAKNGVNSEDLATVDEEDHFRSPVIGCEYA